MVDVSSGIAGGYCTKFLADGGAEVVKLEAPRGDPLRERALGGSLEPDEDGPLFGFLAANKRSVVADPAHAESLARARDLLASADVIVWTPGSSLAEHEELHPDALRVTAPQAIVVAITPFGLTGPWSRLPASDLTLQAWSGGILSRGLPDRPPVQVGGQPSGWMGGLFGAVGALTAWQRRDQRGCGELLDVSTLEALIITEQMYAVTRQSTLPPGGIRQPERQAGRTVIVPGVAQAKDGWVGFMAATAAMWESFCALVDHREWLSNEDLYSYAGRARHRDALERAIADWAEGQTVGEILAQAAHLRVPVAPVGNGAIVTGFDHFCHRHFYIRNPATGLLQPDVPYTLGAAGRRPPGPAPSRGQDGGAHGWPPARRPEPPVGAAAPNELPLAGVRVADFTAFWAGPIVGHFLAMMGAEVIHVESVKRPDGIRSHSLRTTGDELWWEWTPLFHGPNTNKRDLTLDMGTERGRALAHRLIAHCDVLLENFSPRVIEEWGLGWETVSRLRPGLIELRMPAFGLTGPWRDHTGYAQNMEQASGMAWITGFADGPPLVPNGMCDPVAGTHATVALLLALEHRRKSGEGMLVEVPMVGGALNITAEQVLEYQRFGHLMERDGNRSPDAVQNLYRCAPAQGGRSIGEEHEPTDEWVAIAIQSDAEWEALRAALGWPAWVSDLDFTSARGRGTAAEHVDVQLADWCRTRSADDIVSRLWPAGVPVAKVLAPAEVQHIPQLNARAFLETVSHPVVGDQLHYGYPVRFEHGPRRLHRAPAPTLGQHNREILIGLLGLSTQEYEDLVASDEIGDQPVGRHRTR